MYIYIYLYTHLYIYINSAYICAERQQPETLKMDNDVDIFWGLSGCPLLGIRYKNYQQANRLTYQIQV